MFPLSRSRHVTFTLIYWICLLVSMTVHHCGLAQEVASVKPDIGGVLISPTKHRINVRPGQKGTLDFNLENPSQERSIAQMDIVSYLPSDWNYILQEGAVNPRDASSWFAERNFAVELVPGQKTAVKLKYTIPPGLSGTYWCIMRFVPRPVGSTSPRKIVLEVPLVFTIGARERPIIKVSSPVVTKIYEKYPRSPLLVHLPIANEGLGLAVVGVTGELRNTATGRVTMNFSVTDRNLLPLSKRYISFRLPELADGQYRVTMRAELGNRTLPSVSTEYAVVNKEVKSVTEAMVMELPPISLDPSAINIAAPAGSTRSQALRVVNTSDREITLDITPRALEQAATGGIGLGAEILPPGLFVSATPNFLTLRPKGTAVTRLTLKSEKAAEGDLWFGLSITERNNTKAFSNMIESCLTITGTAKPSLEIVNGTVETVNGRPLTVKFTARNTGNQALIPLLSAVVLEDGVRLAARLEVPVLGSGGILPGAELSNSVMLPIDLKPGDYITEISYQYGEDLYAKLRVPVKVEDEKAPAEAATAAINAPVEPKANVTKASPTKPALAKTVSKSPVAKTKPKKP